MGILDSLRPFKRLAEERAAFTEAARDSAARQESEFAHEVTTISSQLRDEDQMGSWEAVGYNRSTGEPNYSERTSASATARMFWKWDPVTRGIVRLTSDFTFGTGFLPPTPRDKATKTRSTQRETFEADSGAAEINAGAEKIIKQLWRDKGNARAIFSPKAQKALDRDLQIYGNVFIHGLQGEGTALKVRSFHPDEFVQIIVDPEDGTTPLWYVRQFYPSTNTMDPDAEQEESEAVIRVYADKNASEEDLDRGRQFWPKGPKVSEGQGWILHVKENYLPHWKFGMSNVIAMCRWAALLRGIKIDQAAIVKANSRFAFKEEYTGSPTRVTAHKGQARSQFETDGSGFTNQAGDTPAAGSIFQQTPGRKLESMSSTTRSSEAKQNAELMLEHMCADAGFGTHYLGTMGNANLATATSVELPAKLMAESRHANWQEVYVELSWAPLENTGQYSEEDLVLEVGKPDIIREDLTALTNALVQGVMNFLIDEESAARVYMETLGLPNIEVALEILRRKRAEAEDERKQMMRDQGNIATNQPGAARQRSNAERAKSMARSGSDQKAKSGTG